jgi:hypothetical protein
MATGFEIANLLVNRGALQRSRRDLAAKVIDEAQIDEAFTEFRGDAKAAAADPEEPQDAGAADAAQTAEVEAFMDDAAPEAFDEAGGLDPTEEAGRLDPVEADTD